MWLPLTHLSTSCVGTRTMSSGCAAGGQVHVWTVDEKDDLDLCQEQGVDVVISNGQDDSCSGSTSGR